MAGTLGLEVARIEIREAEDIAPALEALKSRVDALYICADPLISADRVRINTLALEQRLQRCIRCSAEHVEAGGLMCYGPNFPDLFRRAADYVDKICAGRSRTTSQSSSRPNSTSSST